MKKTIIHCCIFTLLCLGLAQPSMAKGSRSTKRRSLVLYRAGMVQFKAANYWAAITKYNKALAIYEHANIRYYLGEAHRRVGQLRKAYTHYLRYAALLPRAKRRAFKAKLRKLRLGHTSMVSIASQPGGAQILVDGESRGKTPTDGSPLQISIGSGRHRIGLTLSGWLPNEKTITTEFGEPQALSFALQRSRDASLVVTTNVPGADVYLNDVRIGQSPLRLRVGVGAHRLRVTKDGYRDLTRSVLLRSKQETRIVLKLKKGRLSAAAAREAVENQHPEDGVHAGTQSHTLLYLAIASGALAAGGLVTAVVFQSKYNDSFEGDPNLDRDKGLSIAGYVAGGLLGAAAIGLGIWYALDDEAPAEGPSAWIVPLVDQRSAGVSALIRF